MEAFKQTAQVRTSSSKIKVLGYVSGKMQLSCFGFRDAIDTAVIEVMFIYLWLLSLQRIFSCLFKLGKSIHPVYIDISLPSEFKNHPADTDSEFISIIACSDRGKYCTATNTTNSTFQGLSNVSNPSQWEHYMFLELKFGSWVELEEEGCKQTCTQYNSSNSWQYLIGNMATPHGNIAKLEINFN